MVQNTQQQLLSQLKQIQAMVLAMQLQYAAAPQPTNQDYEGRGYYGGQKNVAAKEDVVLNVKEIGEVAVVSGVPVI